MFRENCNSAFKQFAIYPICYLKTSSLYEYGTNSPLTIAGAIFLIYTISEFEQLNLYYFSDLVRSFNAKCPEIFLSHIILVCIMHMFATSLI